MREKDKNRFRKILGLWLIIALAFSIQVPSQASASLLAYSTNTKAASIPSYKGDIYTVVNDNNPLFSESDKNRTDAFETYSELDELGRCQVAYANICKEIMPTEKREDISSIHPSGWQKNSGWERCHLIGFQLAGENANELNLCTGTHSFNVSGMLPFENMIADYVKETKNHVLYRVEPLYKDNELVCRGVVMEAWSVEDNGEGICFNVFVHNIQDGKTINYETGEVTEKGVKKAQYITIKTLSKEYKISTPSKASKSFSMGIGCESKSYTCKKTSGDSVLSVSSKGKVTLKKGTKAGTYKINVKITAKENEAYKEKTITKKVTVTVTSSNSSNNTTSSSTSGKTVYWTQNGTVYHTTKSCPTLSRSKVIYSGTIKESGKERVCKKCS